MSVLQRHVSSSIVDDTLTIVPNNPGLGLHTCPGHRAYRLTTVHNVMAGLLKRLEQGCRKATQQLANNTSFQQKRFASDMYIKQNKHIDEWGTRRENMEFEFTWDTPTTLKTLVWGIGIPAGIYSLLCWTAQKEDAWYGKPVREFMLWSSPEPAAQQE